MTCAAVVTEGHPKCGREATAFVIGPQWIGEGWQAGIVLAPCCDEHLVPVRDWFASDPAIQEFGGEIMAFPMAVRDEVVRELGGDVWEVMHQAC